MYHDFNGQLKNMEQIISWIMFYWDFHFVHARHILTACSRPMVEKVKSALLLKLLGLDVAFVTAAMDMRTGSSSTAIFNPRRSRRTLFCRVCLQSSHLLPEKDANFYYLGRWRTY